MPLQNKGPACAACHRISGLPFPNGGTLGPDLTNAFVKLGAQGIGPTMQTLFFPTMAPIFDPRPLTPAEQQDLRAFLEEAARARTTPPPVTIILGLIALGGFVVLVAVAWVAWRRRLRDVRAALLRTEGTLI